MKSFLVLLVATILWQDGLPLKPEADFELKLDYEFRNKPGIDRFEIDYSNTQEYSGGTLPYLKVSIKLLQLAEGEEKVKIITNLGNRIYSRKASLDKLIELDLGFTDDLKDRVAPHEYNVIFFNSSGDKSFINLFVDDDGAFLVNGEKRGKF
ncbi:MAG: hypothetical protein RIB47_15030 [Cyclobacteriaceae bacterium]